MKVPITRAVFDESDLALIQEPLKSGWVVQGPFVKKFEDTFAEFTGAKNAIACSSCTTGLHIALAALGLGPGDEVIVPAFTWVATANAVEYQGARVVFCDIDRETFNIDVGELKTKISPKTKALIPVHLFGLPANMSEIMRLAAKHRLAVVEDAACGFGSYFKGRHVGTFGDFGVFSFHPRKAITTGEGGMILTADDRHASAARSLRDHGSSKSDLARHDAKAAFLLAGFNQLGFNYRMTDIQGALGVSQMAKAPWIQEQRVRCAERYRTLLKDIDWLKLPRVSEDSVHGYQSFVCRFEPEEPSLKNVERLTGMRNKLLLDLEEEGVSTRQGTHAVTTLGYYRNKYGVRPADFPNALLADRLTVTLPVYAQMSEEEQAYVVDRIGKLRF
jgi:dTDP-4-amino-4,6-dideoxygalactose transaminase